MNARQIQFKQRESQIFAAAEQLLLEYGENSMTLDVLAQRLEVAKGTLYKHFQSKDELFIQLLIRREQALLDIVLTDGMDYPTRMAVYMLDHLHETGRSVLLYHLEERLSAEARHLNHLFSQLYKIRKQRLRRIIALTADYLTAQNSGMTVRDFLAAAWAVSHGAACLLHSSFYQRYLGTRDTLKIALIDQILALPAQHPRTAGDAPMLKLRTQPDAWPKPVDVT